MIDPTPLLDPYWLRVANRFHLRRDAILWFSDSVPALLAVSPGQLAILESYLADPFLRAEWRARLAEEALVATLLNQTGKPAKSLLETIAPWRPFGPDTPLLGELIGKPATCCVIPLDTSDRGDKQAALAHLWFFRQLPPGLRDHKTAWDGTDAFLRGHPGLAMFSVTTCPDQQEICDGESWKLGAALCLRAFDDTKLRDQLARKWIVTGNVAGKDKILPVRIGNKLSHAGRVERRYLLPIDNLKNIEPAYPHQQVLHFASTIEGAVAHVSGRGVEEGGVMDWPTNMEVIHSFVSDTREPIIHLVLLMNPPPKKLVLWYSDKMKGKAADIDAVIGLLRRKGKIKVIPRPIGSGSLVEVEKELHKHLLQDLGVEKPPVLFNVTSGNLLQRLAPVLLARIYPSLWLVYRDRDNWGNPHEFTLLKYDSPIPSSYKLVQRCPDRAINWERLSREIKADRDMPWRQLADEISKRKV